MRPSPFHNKRSEERVVCSETEIISLTHDQPEVGAVQAIIHDKSKSGLGVFYFSNEPQPSKTEFKTEEGIFMNYAVPCRFIRTSSILG